MEEKLDSCFLSVILFVETDWKIFALRGSATTEYSKSSSNSLARKIISRLRTRPIFLNNNEAKAEKKREKKKMVG